jgi:hypothetical protein
MAALGRTRTVDWPHLAFATAIAAWCVWLCWDAWATQADVANLVLILPGALAAAILYVFVAAGCLRPAARPKLAHGVAIKVAGAMALLAGYVVTGPLIGFDVASFAYIFAMLFFLGERRILVLLLVPALFCAIAIYCFDAILATPLPLLFFTGEGS